MPFTAKHKFNSTKPDGVDPLLVQPSNWNDGHDLQTDALTLLGNPNAAPGPVVAVPYANFMASLGLAGANKIINGDFRVDQRNNFLAVSPTTNGYTVDRWMAVASNPGKYTIRAFVGPSTTPSYLIAQSTGVFVPSGMEGAGFLQAIEGINCLDMGFGQSNAKPVTLSFWAYATITGNYSASLRNGAADRNYSFLFNITQVAIWQKFSITIPGDTAGTWRIDNGIGVYVSFSLGAGAGCSGPPNVWQAGNLWAANGGTNVLGVNGAALAVTNVKLEVGSIATPFVPDDIAVSLEKCRRYYQKRLWAPGEFCSVCTAYMTTGLSGRMCDITPMRALPTCTSTSFVGFDQTLSSNNGFTTFNLAANADNIYLHNAIIGSFIGWSVGMAVTLAGGIGNGVLTADAEL